MVTMIKLVQNFSRKEVKMMLNARESGQGLLEYALIISLVAIVIIIAVTAFGGSIVDLYNQVIDAWPE
jgi:pilus assembly protein Flp/PilA